MILRLPRRTTKSRPYFATRVAVVALALGLYVASSGPARMVGAWRFYPSNCTFVAERDCVICGSFEIQPEERQQAWWRALYWPLAWYAEQSWGDSIKRYWTLFPLKDVYEPNPMWQS